MNDRMRSWFRATLWAGVLEFALLAALAAALAHWTWIAFTPRSVAESALSGTDPFRHADAPVKRHLFGAGTPGLLPEQQAAPAPSFRLLGVLSPAAAGKGRAIFASQNGGRRVVNSGDALADGVVLKEVYPDHVVVTREGATERIDLDRRAAAAIPRHGRRDAAR